MPDVLGRDRDAYAGRRVLVIGGGHSAANVLLDLARLAEADHRTQIIWAVRAANLNRVFGGGEADKLDARGKLGEICDLWRAGGCNSVAASPSRRSNAGRDAARGDGTHGLGCTHAWPG